MWRHAHTGSPTLVLVPTEKEEALLVELGGLPPGLGMCARGGFGLVAAAARSAELVATLRPARVVLIGVAGSFDLDRAPIGSARSFDAVALDGIGAGSGERQISSAALGFSHGLDASGAAIHDRLALTAHGPRATSETGSRDARLLLSVCSASSGAEMTSARVRRFPGVLAEDMEAFGVALACAPSATPLAVVRGISNQVGDRDVARWDLRSAMRAAREQALVLLASSRAIP